MSQGIHDALRHIADKYEGSAENIWSGCPSSASLVYRFLEFKGIGPKIATMAANGLVCHFKILVSDHFSIDISPDRHVLRVFKRLGLVPPEPSPGCRGPHQKRPLRAGSKPASDLVVISSP